MFVLFFIFFSGTILAQNAFYYEWYVVGNVRDGVLVFDKKNDQAVYIDLLSTQRKFGKKNSNDLKLDKGEQATIVEAGTSWYDRYFFKNKNKISYTSDLLQTPFSIDDSTLNLVWNLHENVKEIDGFQCKKATVNFRGRMWEVWYTTEIPMYYGPWKFYGLPGLIVAAYESSNEFWFQLTKIKDDPNLKIPIVDVSKHKKVTLKEFDKLEDEVIFGDAGGLFKSVDRTNHKRNGIELIYEWEEQEKTENIKP